MTFSTIYKYTSMCWLDNMEESNILSNVKVLTFNFDLSTVNSIEHSNNLINHIFITKIISKTFTFIVFLFIKTWKFKFRINKKHLMVSFGVFAPF